MKACWLPFLKSDATGTSTRKVAQNDIGANAWKNDEKGQLTDL